MDQARLKYRIVGGIVLVALAAILVPVLNDRRQPLPQGPQAIDIPAEPTEGLASRLPVDAPPLDGSVAEPQDIPPPAPPPPLGEEADALPPDFPPDGDTRLAPSAPPVQAKPPVARPAPASPPAPAVKPAPAAKAPPAAKPAPAPVIASPPPVVKPAPPPAPKPTVTARPEPSSAAPRAPAAKPAAPAPAPMAPAASPVVQQAWVVQLGVFGNLKTAIDLRERLRKAGHSAFTEEVTTPQGKALRVRVGPELDRAKAQDVRDRLARETGQDGIVVAYP